MLKYQRLSSSLNEIEKYIGIEKRDTSSNSEVASQQNHENLIMLDQQQGHGEKENEEQTQKQTQECIINKSIDPIAEETMSLPQETEYNVAEEKTLEELLDESDEPTPSSSLNAENDFLTITPNKSKDIQIQEEQEEEVKQNISVLHRDTESRLKVLSLHYWSFHNLKEYVEIVSSYIVLLRERLSFLHRVIEKVNNISSTILTKEELDLFMKEEITQTPFPKLPAIKRRKSFIQRFREIFLWIKLFFTLGFLIPIILGLTFQVFIFILSSVPPFPFPLSHLLFHLYFNFFYLLFFSFFSIFEYFFNIFYYSYFSVIYLFFLFSLIFYLF